METPMARAQNQGAKSRQHWKHQCSGRADPVGEDGAGGEEGSGKGERRKGKAWSLLKPNMEWFIFSQGVP